jgi:hypothetical protein
MKKNEKMISEIVADLIKNDPSLADKKEELSSLAERLLFAKPNPKLDEKFSLELKTKVLELFTKKYKSAGNKISSPTQYGRWSWVSFSCGLAIVTLVLPFTMAIYPSVWPSEIGNSVVSKNPAAHKVVKVADGAFGPLVVSGGTKNSASDAATEVAPVVQRGVVGMGGGGINVASPAMTKMAVGASSDMGVSPFVPNQSAIKYVYDGEDFDPSVVSTPVYKKTLSSLDLSSMVDVVKQFDFGAFNFRNFTNLKVDNISLKEDREFGYYFNFGGESGSFNLSKNWEKWPQPYANCQNDDCYKEQRIKQDQIPSDDEAIAIANDFLSQYGFSSAGYGQPFVNNDWRVYRDASENKDDYYYPEEVLVVYPLSIDGLSVRDQGGNKNGLSLSIDVRTRKVSSLSGYWSSSFESSNYELVLDKEMIIKKAEEGGLNGGWYYSADERVQGISLDTPELSLVQQWSYDSSTGKGSELYIPCYVFPVKNRSLEKLYLPENIIIPLNKDFFQQNNNEIMPRPLIEPAVMDVPTAEASLK